MSLSPQYCVKCFLKEIEDRNLKCHGVSFGLSVCLSACLPTTLSVCLSVCLFTNHRLSVCVSVCLPVCLSVCQPPLGPLPQCLSPFPAKWQRKLEVKLLPFK